MAAVTAVIAATVVTAYSVKKAADAAEKSTQGGVDKAVGALETSLESQIESLTKQFEYQQEILQPQMERQFGAQERYHDLLGLGDQDPSEVFEGTPGYEFQVEEMNRQLERVGSAGGPNIGGRAIMEAQRRAQGLASDDYYNYLDAVSREAQFGGGPAANAVGTAGVYGRNVADTYRNQGNRLAAIHTRQGENLAEIESNKYAGYNNAIQQGFTNYITQGV